MTLAFLRDFFARPGSTRTVILLEPHAVSEPRQYDIRPKMLLLAAAGLGLLVGLVLTLVVLLTPVRRLFLGPDLDSLRETARTNAVRAAAFEDSVAVQYQQIAQLRALITGEPDPTEGLAAEDGVPVLPEAAEAEAVLGVSVAEPAAPPRAARGAHEAPALPLRWLEADDAPSRVAVAAETYLARLRLPAPSPLSGLLTRSFDARAGHYGVDFAATEGTTVRAFADGFVVFADWTHAGGYVVAIQHADGYLSVYKHNASLLKREGERVRGQETIALSGNTGVVTTGPHLHFELWHHGLAQDPRAFLATPS